MPWWVSQARAGQVLTLGVPQGGAQRGSRAVLCLAGGMDVPEVLGSRSTQLRGAFGGHEGRALRRGDVLRAAGAGRGCRTGFGLVPPALALPLQADGVPAVRVLPAAEYLGFEASLARRLLGRRVEDHARRATATATGWRARRCSPSRRWKCARTASCRA